MMSAECAGVAVDVNDALRPSSVFYINGDNQPVVFDGVIQDKRSFFIDFIWVSRNERPTDMLPCIRTRRDKSQLNS